MARNIRERRISIEFYGLGTCHQNSFPITPASLAPADGGTLSDDHLCRTQRSAPVEHNVGLAHAHLLEDGSGRWRAAILDDPPKMALSSAAIRRAAARRARVTRHPV